MSKFKHIFLFLTLVSLALIGSPIQAESTTEKNEVFKADEICKAIETNFYASIPYDIPRSVINETIDAFLAFIDTDQEAKDHLYCQFPGNHRRRELGFTHRTGLDQGDVKDFFHYHPYLKKFHAEFLASNPIANRLITQMDIIWNYAERTTKDILQSLNGKFPDVYDRVFDTEVPHVVLRLVYYQAEPEQEILARAHFDAGSFTLAIAESAPGLRIGSHQENLQLVPHKEGRAIFMLGGNSNQVLHTDTLKPGWHDVIRLDKLRSRWAIVAFIDAHDLEGPSRDDTHTPDKQDKQG